MKLIELNFHLYPDGGEGKIARMDRRQALDFLRGHHWHWIKVE
jgi:hypothetical protein